MKKKKQLEEAALKEQRIKSDFYTHRYGKGEKIKCVTDVRGYESPKNRSPAELVVDASDGFIPLWARGSVLRWRFKDADIDRLDNPEEVKNYVRRLFGEALVLWGSFLPVQFSEQKSNWDFEISIRSSEDCDQFGCTLASAFFPDQGRHELVIFPTMFGQIEAEQIETLAHEIGHIFGLRHFFANVRETAWPSEVFGTHSRFSIMNYGENSRMTENDRNDLKNLYEHTWSGDLKDINGTPIRLVRPFSKLLTAASILNVSERLEGCRCCICRK